MLFVEQLRSIIHIVALILLLAVNRRVVGSKYQEVVEDRVQRMAPTSDGALAVRQAAIADVAARREYMRVLHIFTQLAVHGKMPKE